MVKELLKRLEIIKIAISIEDEELLELQVFHISKMQCDMDVLYILELMSESKYEQVISIIDKYLKKQSGLVVYEESEIQGLKFELKVLEKKLQDISQEKNEYISLINDFNAQYNFELGEIIREILYLKKEKLEQDAGTQSEEFSFAKDAYESFSYRYEEELKYQRFVLDEEERKDLKNYYKQASKLCHPDVVATNKEEALEIFQNLNDAYTKKDLLMVMEILQMLRKGEAFSVASESINDITKLKEKIAELRQTIEEELHEISTIKKEDNYATICEVDDWNHYFTLLKEQLNEELQRLKKVLYDVSYRENIIVNEEDEWLENLCIWADKYAISDTVLPRDKDKLLELTNLDLSSCNLLSLTKEIGNLVNLVTLNLFKNFIIKIPKEIGNLTQLTVLNFGENQLEELPSEIGNLTNLIKLNLDENQLESIPNEIGNLVYLSELRLFRNKLKKLPIVIGNLVNLKELNLAGNHLNTLPKEIGKLSRLSVLNLMGNEIVELPEELSHLTNLEKLNLGGNQMTRLPKEILKLSNLVELDLFLNPNLTLTKEQKNWQNSFSEDWL
ncbi:MAG: hypothetical protein NTZ60_03685 [Campylobacterales bacterium]|nr:hypothetical protein [Campylobacterales bacterium]